MIQRSDEWNCARLGNVTASRVADIMPGVRGGYLASRKNYMAELICERLTGKPQESFQSEPMIRGIELEPYARSMYEAKNGVWVTEVGYLPHPTIEHFGGSPDGLVGEDGLIEIKCPNTATMIDVLMTEKVDRIYYTQMQVYMILAGAQWCDYVVYDDRLPENLCYFQKRVGADDKYMVEIETEVKKFLVELDDLEWKLREVSNA